MVIFTIYAVYWRTKKMIDWDLAPEGADKLAESVEWGYLRWGNSLGKYWGSNSWFNSNDEYKTIATRPTKTKTVEDAVEWHKKSFGSLNWCCDTCDVVCCEGDWMYLTQESALVESDSHAVVICTRAEFEACAAKKGEKWTHTYGHAGYKCKVISVDGEHSWILTEKGDKLTEYTSSLNPIKPKLTKKEYDLLGGLAIHFGINHKEFMGYLDKYDSQLKD